MRHQLHLAAEGSDVADEDLCGVDIAILDLGDPAWSHAYDLRQLRPGETQALAPIGGSPRGRAVGISTLA
jgi:hypothetical protein